MLILLYAAAPHKHFIRATIQKSKYLEEQWYLKKKKVPLNLVPHRSGTANETFNVGCLLAPLAAKSFI